MSSISPFGIARVARFGAKSSRCRPGTGEKIRKQVSPAADRGCQRIHLRGAKEIQVGGRRFVKARPFGFAAVCLVAVTVGRDDHLAPGELGGVVLALTVAGGTGTPNKTLRSSSTRRTTGGRRTQPPHPRSLPPRAAPIATSKCGRRVRRPRRRQPGEGMRPSAAPRELSRHSKRGSRGSTKKRSRTQSAAGNAVTATASAAIANGVEARCPTLCSDRR